MHGALATGPARFSIISHEPAFVKKKFAKICTNFYPEFCIKFPIDFFTYLWYIIITKGKSK